MRLSSKPLSLTACCRSRNRNCFVLRTRTFEQYLANQPWPENDITAALSFYHRLVLNDIHTAPSDTLPVSQSSSRPLQDSSQQQQYLLYMSTIQTGGSIFLQPKHPHRRCRIRLRLLQHLILQPVIPEDQGLLSDSVPKDKSGLTGHNTANYIRNPVMV